MSDDPRLKILVGTALGVAALALALALALEADDEMIEPMAPSESTPALPPARGSSEAPAEPPEPPRAEPPEPSRKRYASPEQLRQHAAARQRIQEALDRRTAAEPGPERPRRPRRPDTMAMIIDGDLDEAYVRAAVREDLIPLAQECYASVLETDPKFGGKLVLEFDVMGDGEVGGIIDDARAGEGTTMTNPDFIECMSESMMTVMMDPPPDGGVAHVSYPLSFEYDAD